MTEAKHSKYSASAAKRWMNCPGSMVLCVGLVDHGSKYADEGTKAHAASEELLTTGAISTVTGVDGDMLKHVGVYTGNIKQYAEGGTLMVEQRVNYSRFLGVDTGEAWGTSDAIVIQGNEVQVHDLKYGQGELVSADGNEQMMLYALGAYDALDDLAGPFTHFRTAIHQVRVDPRPQEWDGTVETLLAFGEVAKRAVHAVKAAEFGFQSVADGTKTQAEWEAEYLNPGEGQCRWCKAKATCPALYKMTSDTLLADFEQIDEAPQPHKLSFAQMRLALENKGLIEAWLLSVENSVKDLLLEGGTFEGFKLVEGRSVRKWSDEDQAGERLVDLVGEQNAFTKKLISPAQAEKLLGKKDKALIADIVAKPRGAATLAKETDPRPAISPVDADFDALDCDETEA